MSFLTGKTKTLYEVANANNVDVIEATLREGEINNGVCGNCNALAINPFEDVCKQCCDDHGLSSFPEYVYPSLLSYSIGVKSHQARNYFIYGE